MFSWREINIEASKNNHTLKEKEEEILEKEIEMEKVRSVTEKEAQLGTRNT